MTTYLFYDFETDGAEPSICRPTQFAAIRTDERLNLIEEAQITTWCQPPRDRLPAPEACLVTGITPQMAAARGTTEALFFGDIHRLFNTPGTLSLGWNSTRFDDTVSRFGFWRNFLDPYEHSYKKNCSTWDLIDLARAARALRPSGIRWPSRDDGAPSFRLEDLTAANEIEHGDAHDAMADVRATIDLGSLLLEHQPDLWEWARSLTNTDKVEKILKSNRPFVHTSSRVPAQLGCTSPFRMLAPHPVNRRSFICWDLREDPSELLESDSEEIIRRTFSSTLKLGDEKRFSLKEIKSNKAPFLGPVSVLNEKCDSELLQLDEDRWRSHDAILMKNRSALQTLIARIQEAWHPKEHDPVDAAEALYEGFPSNQDIRLRDKVAGSDHSTLADIGVRFQDSRLQSLMLHYRAREAPETLDVDEQRCWKQRCRDRLLDPPGKSTGWPDWLEHVRDLAADPAKSIEEIEILKSVEIWGVELADSIGLPVPMQRDVD